MECRWWRRTRRKAVANDGMGKPSRMVAVDTQGRAASAGGESRQRESESEKTTGKRDLIYSVAEIGGIITDPMY